MASAARVGKTISLEEFLRLPEIEEPPYKEYVAGRVEAKSYLSTRGSVLMGRLSCSLNLFAAARGLGEAFLSLRCTFAGRSVICAIAFLSEAHIGVDERGEYADETRIPPDLYIEFVGPEDCSDERPRERLSFATAHDTALGWLIDPERMTVEVYRPSRRPKRLPADGVLEGDPVLPGYRLPVAELFDWLIWRKPDRQPSPPQPESATPGESS
jgi:Uma2 family endonuclease